MNDSLSLAMNAANTYANIFLGMASLWFLMAVCSRYQRLISSVLYFCVGIIFSVIGLFYTISNLFHTLPKLFPDFFLLFFWMLIMGGAFARLRSMKKIFKTSEKNENDGIEVDIKEE